MPLVKRFTRLIAAVIALGLFFSPMDSRAVEATLVFKESGHWVSTMPPWRSRPLMDMIHRLSERIGPRARALGLDYRAAWLPTGFASAKIPVELTLEQMEILQKFLTEPLPVTPLPAKLTEQERAEREAALFSDDWVDPHPIPKLHIPLQARVLAGLDGKSFFHGVREVSLGVGGSESDRQLILYLQLTAYTHGILQDVLVDGKSLKGTLCQRILRSLR